LKPISADAFTIGVEEEYQLIDATTGELRSRARYVLASDWTGDIKPEMQENTVEVGTRICPETSCVRDELARLRFQAAIGAEAQGLQVVAAGTHPFSHWTGQEFTDQPVYQKLRRDYRRLAESQNIFGMHIHVSVPDGVDRVAVMNVARLYLPHLLALTASSPFFLGEETGYASYRSILWRRWPRSGVPPRFRDREEYDRLLGLLLRMGRIDAPGRLYWDMRPHHEYPTVEFRVADVTPRLEDAVVAAALARGIVAGAVEGLLQEPDLPDSIVQTLVSDNSWRAARDGPAADFVNVSSADGMEVEPARDALLRLADQLAPLIRQLGDEEAITELPALLERGGAAARMQEHWRTNGGDLAELTQWLAQETVLGTGADRRREQRVDA
jgi:carboxylate-amine ligase